MPPQRQRRSRAELRQLVLDAGAELIRSEGPGIGASKLTYKAVFDRVLQTTGIVVTRGSVHERIWNSQHDFQIDVLRHAASTGVLEGFEPAIDAAVDAIAPSATVGAPDRDEQLRTAVRIGSTTFLDEPDSEQWRSWMGTISVLALLDDDDPSATEVRASIATRYGTVRADIIAPLREFLVYLGLRPRADMFGEDITEAEAVAYPLVATMFHAMAEGTSLRSGLDTFETADITLPSASDGNDERWDLVGLHAFAVARALFEPLPGSDD